MFPGVSVWTTCRVEVGTNPQIMAAVRSASGPIHDAFIGVGVLDLGRGLYRDCPSHVP
jgi:hypothetical protein